MGFKRSFRGAYGRGKPLKLQSSNCNCNCTCKPRQAGEDELEMKIFNVDPRERGAQVKYPCTDVLCRRMLRLRVKIEERKRRVCSGTACEGDGSTSPAVSRYRGLYLARESSSPSSLGLFFFNCSSVALLFLSCAFGLFLSLSGDADGRQGFPVMMGSSASASPPPAVLSFSSLLMTR